MVVTVFDVHSSMLFFSLLYWIYIICILQCAIVAVFVITMLNVYCSVLFFSLLCWMYIVVALAVITMFDV